jgi:signal transduction histidine kinase
MEWAQPKIRRPKQPSLRGRIFWSLAWTYLVFSIIGGVSAGLFSWSFTDGWRHSARPLAGEVLESLKRENGVLVLHPTADLSRWQQQDKGLWYVATDGRQVFSQGRPPVPDSAILAAFPAFAGGFEMIWQGSSDRPFGSNGGAIEHGKEYLADVTVVAGGLAPALIGAGRQGLILSGLLSFLIGAITLAVPVLIALWWVLSRETRLLTRIGEEVSAIGPRELTKRIDTAPIPREILPLAVGVNRALAELQAGFDRERLFASMAAHELRTPLAVLTAHLDALPEGTNKSSLLSDARRLRRLAEDLLTFSHLAGRRNQTSEVELSLICREALASLASDAQEAGVELTFKAGTTQEQFVGEATALGLMVTNLVRNAIQHSPRGKTVSVRVCDGPKITVEDSGPGVPLELRQRVFEPFFRGDDVPYNGGGLGLAIVAEVTSAHGATVSIETSANGGAVFVVDFKLMRFAVS